VIGDFAVAIYEPTGERCSGKGSVTTDFNGDTDGALAIATQSDGKIVLVGFAGNGTDCDFALARYEGGDCPANIWLGHYVAVHIFVHPQRAGRPARPDFRKQLYNRLQLGLVSLRRPGLLFVRIIVKHDRRPHEAVETEAIRQRVLIDILRDHLDALLLERLD
jgi:hypothetical protein